MLQEGATYIYALVDPRESDHIRYVGKTEKLLRRRLTGHRHEARKQKNTHKCHFIRKLWAEGVEPEIIPLAIVPLTEWEFYEQRFIEGLENRGHKLTNAQPGGEGVTSEFWTEVTIRAWENNPERREQASENMKELWEDPSFREAQAEAMKERWSDPDRRVKHQRIMSEIWSNPEYKKRVGKNISEAVRKTWLDPEVRAARIQSASKTRRGRAAFRKLMDMFEYRANMTTLEDWF